MYKFRAYGHKNITARHKTTLEFTKDSDLSLKGDCIVGVKADFNLKELKEFIKKSIEKNKKQVKITIQVGNNTETINAELNPDFDDDKEMVIRKTGFISERTLAIKANKSSSELKKELIYSLKKPETPIKVTLTEMN